MSEGATTPKAAAASGPPRLEIRPIRPIQRPESGRRAESDPLGESGRPGESGRLSEHARLGDIIVEAYRRVAGAPREPSYEAELRDVETRAERSTVLVAVLDGKLVGGVTYVSGPDDPYAELLEAGDAGIRMLAVNPDSQGRGIGKALVEACVVRARQTGRTRVVLHTTPWMTRAQHVYEAMGFRRLPEIDWRPLPDIQLLGYVLELPPGPADDSDARSQAGGPRLDAGAAASS